MPLTTVSLNAAGGWSSAAGKSDNVSAFRVEAFARPKSPVDDCSTTGVHNRARAGSRTTSSRSSRVEAHADSTNPSTLLFAATAHPHEAQGPSKPGERRGLTCSGNDVYRAELETSRFAFSQRYASCSPDAERHYLVAGRAFSLR
jgi:hypothetical protein